MIKFEYIDNMSETEVRNILHYIGKANCSEETKMLPFLVPLAAWE